MRRTHIRSKLWLCICNESM